MSIEKRFALDWEFQKDGFARMPISVGLVSDTGKKFYAIFTDFDSSTAEPFVEKEVLPRLYAVDEDIEIFVGDTNEVASALLEFIAPEEGKDILFYADQGGDDFTLLNMLIGGESGFAPKAIRELGGKYTDYRNVRDLRRSMEVKSFPEDIRRPPKEKSHIAIYDAETVMKQLLWLDNVQQERNAKAARELTLNISHAYLAGPELR